MVASAARERNKVLYENKYTMRHKRGAVWGKDNEFTTINNTLLSSDMTLYYFSTTDLLALRTDIWTECWLLDTNSC